MSEEYNCDYGDGSARGYGNEFGDAGCHPDSDAYEHIDGWGDGGGEEGAWGYLNGEGSGYGRGDSCGDGFGKGHGKGEADDQDWCIEDHGWCQHD